MLPSPSMRCVSNRILAIAFFMASMQTMADGDKQHDAQGYVTIKDGVPCFFIDGKSNTKPDLYMGIRVVDNGGTMPTMLRWRADSGRAMDRAPVDKATCVKYGEKWPGALTLNPPQTLEDGARYIATIQYNALWRVNFCLSHKGGDLHATKWNTDDKVCTEEPVDDPDHPSAWHRLFG